MLEIRTSFRLISYWKRLGLRRNENTWYYPGVFSFSFEEQLDDLDFKSGDAYAAEHWIQRAVCEEVFPLLGHYKVSPSVAWNQVNDYIDYMRFWSVFLEEEIGNFSLMAHIKLNVDSATYCKTYREMKANGGQRDREGSLFVLEGKAVAPLLQGKNTTVREILVDDIDNMSAFGEHFQVQELHPTSRYRLLWWANATGRMTS